MFDFPLADLVKGRDGVTIGDLQLKRMGPPTPQEAFDAAGLGDITTARVIGFPATLTTDAFYVTARVRRRTDDEDEWTISWLDIPSIAPPDVLVRLSSKVGGLAGLSSKIAELWRSYPAKFTLINATYGLENYSSPLLPKSRKRIGDVKLSPTGTLHTVHNLPFVRGVTVTLDPHDMRNSIIVNAVGSRDEGGIVDVAALEREMWQDIAKLVTKR